MDKITEKRKELENIIMNHPEICDAMLLFLQEKADRQYHLRKDPEEAGEAASDYQ